MSLSDADAAVAGQGPIRDLVSLGLSASLLKKVPLASTTGPMSDSCFRKQP